LAESRFKLECKKVEKMRLSILFGASQLGEKMPLLIIGESRHPRSFKNKYLGARGIIYCFNDFSWMSSDIFKFILQK
jgi:hypothetical protein